MQELRNSLVEKNKVFKYAVNETKMENVGNITALNSKLFF